MMKNKPKEYKLLNDMYMKSTTKNYMNEKGLMVTEDKKENKERIFKKTKVLKVSDIKNRKYNPICCNRK